MNRRVIIGVVIVAVVVAGAAVVWWLASPLFIDRVVDEEFPDAAELAANPEKLMDMPEEERAEVQDEVMDAAASMPDTQASDAMPEASGGPLTLAQGAFMDADEFHQGSGTATLYQLEDGSHVLRFESFSVTNGPDLHVFLLQGEGMEGALDLGSLKGNVGDQNYDIPGGTDVSAFSGVSIYCVPFHVTFATAAFE